MTWLSLAIGGITGTFARYYLSKTIHSSLPNSPVGTLAVTLTGCFLIGIFAVMPAEKSFFGLHVKLLLIAGFCGAFTTFSTFIVEMAAMIQQGHTLRAFAYVMGSVVLGFAVFRAGMALGEFASPSF